MCVDEQMNATKKNISRRNNKFGQIIVDINDIANDTIAFIAILIIALIFNLSKYLLNTFLMTCDYPRTRIRVTDGLGL
jgi:hypothetical protein